MANGLIYQKYNLNEVSKAVDTVVDELAPIVPEAAPDVVSVESLNNANNTISELQSQLSALSNQATDLNNQISNLKTQAENDRNKKLSVEQENDIVVNQLDSLSKVLNQLTDQLSVALQKSIDESVMRTSLHAANQGYKAQIEAYIKQIDTLNNLIFGLQAQLGAIQEQRVLEQSNFQQQILLTQQQLSTSQQSLTAAELQLLQLQQQQAALIAAGGTTSGTTSATSTTGATSGTTAGTTAGTSTAGATAGATLPPGDIVNNVAVVTLGKFLYNGKSSPYTLRTPIYARFKGAKPDGTWNAADGALPWAIWGNGETINVFNSDTQPITVNILPSYTGRNNFLGLTPKWYIPSPAVATLQPNETKTFNLTLDWQSTRGMDSRLQTTNYLLFSSTNWTPSKTYFDGDLVVKVTRSNGTSATKAYATSYEVISTPNWI